MPSDAVRAEERAFVERALEAQKRQRDLGFGVNTAGGKGKKMGRPAGAQMARKQDEMEARFVRRYLAK